MCTQITYTGHRGHPPNKEKPGETPVSQFWCDRQLTSRKPLSAQAKNGWTWWDRGLSWYHNDRLNDYYCNYISTHLHSVNFKKITNTSPISPMTESGRIDPMIPQQVRQLFGLTRWMRTRQRRHTGINPRADGALRLWLCWLRRWSQRSWPGVQIDGFRRMSWLEARKQVTTVKPVMATTWPWRPLFLVTDAFTFKTTRIRRPLAQRDRRPPTRDRFVQC